MTRHLATFVNTGQCEAFPEHTTAPSHHRCARATVTGTLSGGTSTSLKLTRRAGPHLTVRYDGLGEIALTSLATGLA
jgi:hypothetical protein